MRYSTCSRNRHFLFLLDCSIVSKSVLKMCLLSLLHISLCSFYICRIVLFRADCAYHRFSRCVVRHSGPSTVPGQVSIKGKQPF